MLFPSCFASLFSTAISWLMGFPGGSAVKNPPASAGDRGSTPGSGRSPGEGKGNPLQYSCLENPMHRGAWQATVHGVTKKSQTWLSNWATTTINSIAAACLGLLILYLPPLRELFLPSGQPLIPLQNISFRLCFLEQFLILTVLGQFS